MTFFTQCISFFSAFIDLSSFFAGLLVGVAGFLTLRNAYRFLTSHRALLPLLIVIIVLFAILGCSPLYSAYAASPQTQTHVDPAIIQAAQEQANDSMRQAWQQNSEDKVQPVNTLVGPDGTVVLTQNAPKQIVTLPDGTLGLSKSQTMITVIQQPTPLPLPTIVPQDSRIQTTVNGIDHIETKAILPEHLVVDQLDAIKKIADNGALIAQQRFAVEQYKIHSESQLEWLRITKSFVLWGFLFSIPFILTMYWITRNIALGWKNWQKEVFEFKQKELESAERITRSD